MRVRPRISSSNFHPLCPVVGVQCNCTSTSKHCAQCSATHSVVNIVPSALLHTSILVNIVPSERPAPSLSAVRLLANVHTQRQSQIHNKVAQVSVEQGVVGCCAEVEVKPSKVLSPIMSARRGPLAGWTPSPSHHQPIPFIRIITATTRHNNY